MDSGGSQGSGSQVAVVTGAGQGLGEAIARRLAGEGARVILVDINGEAAARVAREIEAAGTGAIVQEVDVSDWEAVQKLAGTVLDAYGSQELSQLKCQGVSSQPVR